MRHFSQHALVVALVSCAQASFAQSIAEEEDLVLSYGDKATISIATGSEQPLRRAPAVATVITAQDITAMGAKDLDDVLETVPGMHVARNPSAYAPLYVIRGVYSRFTPQTLMLQNGIPMTTMYTGDKGFVWGGLPLDNVARIEIIRGPGSALYGADAYAGVINIITKNAADTPGTQGGMRAGSFKTWDGWVQHGGKLGPVDVAAYLRVGTTDGLSETVTVDAQSRNDTVFGTKATLAPGRLNLGYNAVDAALEFGYDKWRLRSAYKLRDKLGTGAGIASALDPVGSARSERITADVSWTDPSLGGDWGAGALASYLHYADLVNDNFVLFPAGVRFPTGTFPNGMIGGPQRWERQLRLSAYATYAGFANHKLRLGFGHDDLNLYKTQEAKNFTFTASGVPVPLPSVIDFSHTAPFMLPQRRSVNYAYLQDEWNFAKDWAFTAGLRRDLFSDFDGTTNPRVAVVWDAAYNLTAKLLYGTAFRAPAFVEEYSINNPVARGNPGLRPETIKTLEAALTWHAHRDVQVNLSVFRYAMEDIIRTVPNSIVGTGATYNNTGSQSGNGLELELVWDVVPNLRMSGNYASQRSIDGTTNQDAGYAPHHHVYARADWSFAGGWMLSPQVNGVADRKRASGDTRSQIPDFATLDIALRTSSTKRDWDFSVSVRNLLNADVREPSAAPGLVMPNDLPMAPRTVFFQAIYRP